MEPTFQKKNPDCSWKCDKFYFFSQVKNDYNFVIQAFDEERNNVVAIKRVDLSSADEAQVCNAFFYRSLFYLLHFL